MEEGGDQEEETVGAVQRVTMEIDLEELLRKRHRYKLRNLIPRILRFSLFC